MYKFAVFFYAGQRDHGGWLIPGILAFLADLFSAISKYSLLLQRNDVILPQVSFTSWSKNKSSLFEISVLCHVKSTTKLCLDGITLTGSQQLEEPYPQH